MKFRRLNWADVSDGERPEWCPVGLRLCAVWPSPVDHDACFAAAGFSDFADSDEDWDADLEALANALLAHLAARGVPRLAKASRAQPPHHHEHALASALLDSARDDGFGPCLIEFGEGPEAVLRTSDGHPIFWIGLARGDASELLVSAARVELREVRLDWSKLCG